MALKNQSYFTAKIGNVDLYSIKSMINYKIDNLEDRMKCVDIALAHGDEFYQEYFDKYCDTGITSNDLLLSESNVVQSLEGMANYILAKDPEYNKTEDSYFVRHDRLVDKINKEDEFGGTESSLLLCEDDSVLPYEEVKNKQNYKKLKKQTIKPDDLQRNDDLGDILRDYNTFLDLISQHTKKNNTINKSAKKANLYMYTKQHSSIKDDMIICKDSMMKTHGYTLKYFSESTKPSYDVIDITNIDHLLGGKVEYNDVIAKSNGLLSFKPTDDYQNDFNCIIVDVQNIIDSIDLNEFELDTIELYRNGLNANAIAKELDSYNVTIERTLKKIAKKISLKAKQMYK